jgi:hypothetical protein
MVFIRVLGFPPGEAAGSPSPMSAEFLEGKNLNGWENGYKRFIAPTGPARLDACGTNGLCRKSLIQSNQ